MVIGGEDEIRRWGGTGPRVEHLEGQAVVAGRPLHVALGGVGPAVVGADPSVRRRGRGAAGGTDANAVLAASTVIAPHSLTQVCKKDRSDEELQTRGIDGWNKLPQSPDEATTMNCCFRQAACFSSHSFR